MKNLSALTLTLFTAIGCSSSDENPGEQPDSGLPFDASLSDAGSTGDATLADAAPTAPTPVFTIGGTTSGSIAVSNDAILPTYTADGVESPSLVRLSLTASELDETCSVLVSAVLVGFSRKTTTTRSFQTATLDIGAGTMLQNDCGWDESYMLSEFSARGSVQAGFARARFPEDGPGLDLYINRSWGLPGQTASIVRTGAAFGFPMDDQGVVDTNMLVQPSGGPLIQAVYQW